MAYEQHKTHGFEPRAVFSNIPNPCNGRRWSTSVKPMLLVSVVRASVCVRTYDGMNGRANFAGFAMGFISVLIRHVIDQLATELYTDTI